MAKAVVKARVKRKKGYYLTINDEFNIHKVRKIAVKTKAIEEAKAILGIVDVKSVGVVRANDKTLLLKLSLNKGRVVTEKVK